ncbi:hypothetical protein [Pontibacter sp. SGAir0037]|uniref:hypothetical protein n=1 Tax=Pontibacter sp. SGAir0037 TaxID=2571030 RepID=UPI0010CCBF2A|nr:hypothetical protein [Pontibacter sp. SGAir0037]QCR25308.1 hypothetical protein C1N53_22595 [Pontibacter sp. SGAir0037]
MNRVKGILQNGTTIILENYDQSNVDDMYFIKAIEATNRRNHRTIAEYFNGLIRSLETVQQEVREQKVQQLLSQYRDRPVVSEMVRQERREQLGQTNHIASCEGYEEEELNKVLDELYINGQITPEEMNQVFNLKYL